MKSAQLRILSVAPSALLPGEIGVDLFAGGGGWAEGFQWATGVPPAIAVNHDEDAIVMHTANHPESEHYHEDVFDVDPTTATRGRAVGWLHASPDCRHFSRAKGSTPKTARPLSKKIRGLAWVAVKWAAAVRPRIISLENVAEFVTWGPLYQQARFEGDSRVNTPIRKLGGTTFRKFIAALQALGYAVEWRTLKACDFGAPTSRTRLFVIARCDGQPIVWPKPTHGPKTKQPYRTAAECIDWSIEMKSIFDRKKPLADATLRRIAEGIRRYVLNNPHPYIVNLTHGGRLEPITAPFNTITGAHPGEKALVAPSLVQMGYGERKGQRPRALDLQQPLGTIVAGGKKHGLVAALLKHYGGVVGQPLDRPLGTVTARDHHSVLACHIESMYSNSKGMPVDEPMPTLTAQSNHHGLVAACASKYYGNDSHGQAIDEPLDTVTTKDRFALVAALLERFLPGMSFPNGVVTITLDDTVYAIVDIFMRMFWPRELATAQGFPKTYILTGNKTQQVEKVGNSVPPHFANAIVRANTGQFDEAEEAAA